MDYREPVKITVDKEIALTVTDLNKTLIVTNEKNVDFAYCATLEEVAEKFGNNTKIYKAVETFLSQTDGSGNILKPDFFAVMGVEKGEDDDSTYATKLKTAINEVLNESWYCLITIMDTAKIVEELRAVLVSERRVYIAETATYPLENADKAKSERAQLIYNSKTADGEDREYKSAAYAGAVITAGAGNKCSMVKLSGVSADVTGGKKQELTKNNITFVEKRTSEGYILANGGKAMDGTYFDETTALDCMIVNLNEALQKMLILKGFPQDEEGYTRMEETITSIMEQLGAKDIIAKENGIYEYKVTPVSQTKEERMARTIKPNVLFRLKGWAYFIDLTLKQTYDTVNKGN